MALGGIEGRSLETGTLLPWPIRALFSRLAGWLSVMRVQRVCDKSEVNGPAQAKLERGTLQSWDGREVRSLSMGRVLPYVNAIPSKLKAWASRPIRFLFLRVAGWVVCDAAHDLDVMKKVKGNFSMSANAC